MQYSREFIDEVKKNVDIVEIVSETIRLRRVGRLYRGKCPDHTDTQPSFTVYPETGSFYCFGCHKGSRNNGRSSDVIAFLRSVRGMSFPQAVAYLAKRAGLHPPNTSPPAPRAASERPGLPCTPPKDEHQRPPRRLPARASGASQTTTALAQRLRTQAASFYHDLLRQPGGAAARRYLKHERGLADSLIDQFQLGFAPGRRVLLKHLTNQGFTPQQCRAAGLVAERKGQLWDYFFGGLITVPHPLHGHIHAFTVKDPDPQRIADNTRITIRLGPKDCFFHHDALDRHQDLILVEGEMDLFAILQLTHHTNVVALGGTALTHPQMQALRASPVRRLFLCLDSDTAGAIATQRLTTGLREQGYTVFPIRFRGPKDIDKFLRHVYRPQEEFERLLQQAQRQSTSPPSHIR